MQYRSFHLQIFFLGHRAQQHLDMWNDPRNAIIDRSIYEDAEVFARNLYVQGNMAERDYETYRSLYITLAETLPPPDLVIYLKASIDTLVKRISLRSRDYERTISHQYLEQLNQLYSTWIDGFTLCPVLTVPADNLDYVKQSRHLDLVIQKVQQKLTGKEEVIFSDDEVG